MTGSTIRKYYSFAGQTLAVRTWNVELETWDLSYFLTDHLGSIVAVTDASGTLTSQQRYLPFGEVRSDVGTISQTDYGYTGQRNNSYIKLLDYRFRWYSPQLARFISPDSIVPNLYNPQALNRYSYVANRPLNFNDPTGHKMECDDGPQTWAACKQQLRNFAETTLKDLGGKDDLEAMARIVDRAADLYGDYDNMIPVLSGIFIGIEESNSWTVVNALGADPCAAVGREIADCGSNKIQFWDTGFHDDYRDGHNQLFHFWAYFATAVNIEGKGPASYIPGAVVSHIGNELHEKYLPIFIDDPQATWQDYALTRMAISLGTLANMGAIRPNQLGNAIRDYVGINAPGAPYVPVLITIAPLEGNR
ncbi:MAG: RHS repeat-associated core domain-containing protein [Chloroflexota bacterium]